MGGRTGHFSLGKCTVTVTVVPICMCTYNTFGMYIHTLLQEHTYMPAACKISCVYTYWPIWMLVFNWIPLQQTYVHTYTYTYICTYTYEMSRIMVMAGAQSLPMVAQHPCMYIHTYTHTYAHIHMWWAAVCLRWQRLPWGDLGAREMAATNIMCKTHKRLISQKRRFSYIHTYKHMYA